MKTAVANKQFGVMAGERLRLNIFGLLKIRSSIEVYRLKSATNAKLPDVTCKTKKTTVQNKMRLDKLIIKNQIQDIRVIGFYSSDLTNQLTRTCNHLNLNIMDTS